MTHPALTLITKTYTYSFKPNNCTNFVVSNPLSTTSPTSNQNPYPNKITFIIPCSHNLPFSYSWHLRVLEYLSNAVQDRNMIPILIRTSDGSLCGGWTRQVDNMFWYHFRIWASTLKFLHNECEDSRSFRHLLQALHLPLWKQNHIIHTNGENLERTRLNNWIYNQRSKFNCQRYQYIKYSDLHL